MEHPGLLNHENELYVRASWIASDQSKFKYVDPVKLKEAQNVGTHVHEAIESFLRGMPPEGLMNTLNEREKFFFSSYLTWIEIVNPTLVFSERRFFDKTRRLTGCIDALYDIPGRGVCLVDYKTSKAESDSWIRQAHLYYYLLEENHVFSTGKFLFIRLSEQGFLPKCHEYTYEPHVFYSCLKDVDKFWEKFNQ